MTTYNVSSEVIHKSADHAASDLDNLGTFKLLLSVTFTLSFTKPSFHPALPPRYKFAFGYVLYLTFLSL